MAVIYGIPDPNPQILLKQGTLYMYNCTGKGNTLIAEAGLREYSMCVRHGGMAQLELSLYMGQVQQFTQEIEVIQNAITKGMSIQDLLAVIRSKMNDRR